MTKYQVLIKQRKNWFATEYEKHYFDTIEQAEWFYNHLPITVKKERPCEVMNG